MDLSPVKCQINCPRTLTNLPGDALSIIYQRLYDRESRQAFFGCCKTVRWAPQVLEHISKTTLHFFQVAHQNRLDELRFFPRGDCLRVLTTIQMSGPPDAESKTCLDQLCQQDGPSKEKDVLLQVQELHLGNLSGNNKALPFLCPNLVKLTISYCPMSSLLGLFEDAQVHLSHLQTLRLDELVMKGWSHKKLHEAMQVISGKTEGVEWLIRKVPFIFINAEDPVHRHPFLAMEGTSAAAGVGSVTFYYGDPYAEEMDLVARVFPNAVHVEPGKKWWRYSSLIALADRHNFNKTIW